MMASARAAARRIAAPKKATFARSCHSGCSIRVRSCTVTTSGPERARGRL